MRGREENIEPVEQYVIDIVRDLRTSKGISQQRLALELGVSKSFISSVESKNFPGKYNIRHLNILAKVFGCSPRDFLPEKPL
jgi:transcriptional regulator with XRE-family HTH domain